MPAHKASDLLVVSTSGSREEETRLRGTRRKGDGGQDGRRGQETEGERSAQGARRVKTRGQDRLLAARATGGAFGAHSRGAATPPVVTLRVLTD